MAGLARLRPTLDRRAALIAVAVIVAAAAIGVGAFLIGRSGGEDLSAARAKGHRAGVTLGFAAGTHRGYVRGFAASHRRPSRAAFKRAYVFAYRRAFLKAGLQPPSHVSVPNP